MKDSFDKDPFAEYDKYWDDLDKKEEKVNRRQKKDYRFNPQKFESKQSSPDDNKKVISIVVGVFFFMMFFGIFIPVIINIVSSPFPSYHGMGMNLSMFAPFIGIIFFVVILGFIIRASKKD